MADFDDTLLKAIAQLVEEEKQEKKKKQWLVREKRLQYYSGWKR